MDVAGRVAVVTGGGGGIGGAIAEALVRAGARVVVADLAEDAARGVVDRLPAGSAVAAGADVSAAAEIERVLAVAEREFGPVELYFANAGVAGPSGLGDDVAWDLAIDVNLRAHVRAARLLLPGWLERGEGYFVSTASAAGLLTQLGAAAYSATKHAAVGFAEWLSITYGGAGIRVSCLCPMGVDTKLLYAGLDSGESVGALATRAVTSAGTVLAPADVADAVLAAIAEERFLVLPHEEVAGMVRGKAGDHERWLRGMRRYQASLQDPPA
jgi:NAD(P)-dependent dehydrogenase (short-subunit alcohol dehydrogenase family)